MKIHTLSLSQMVKVTACRCTGEKELTRCHAAPLLTRHFTRKVMQFYQSDTRKQTFKRL